MTLTAKISRNFRDTETGAPKVLLRSIQTEDEEYRDHAWVEMTKELKTLLQTKRAMSNRSYIIQFEADEKVYKYRDQEYKKTLQNVHNIKILGRA